MFATRQCHIFTRHLRVVASNVIVEKSSTMFVDRYERARFPKISSRASGRSRRELAGVPLSASMGAWCGVYIRTRDKVREPAGGHRSPRSSVVRDSLSYEAVS